MHIRFARTLLAATAVLAIAAPRPLAAAPTPLPIGSWQIFTWSGGVGPIDNPADGFFLEALGPTMLRVVDCCITGDAFDVYINGLFAFGTPSVPAGIDTGAVTGDDAWANPDLSKGSIVLGAGLYTIEINVREIAPGFESGGAFIRADDFQQVVPEPISMVLLGTGLAGIAGARRRRRNR